MASIKVKYRPSTRTGKRGAIYYQIIMDRKVRQINTDYRIFPDEWDSSRSAVIRGKNDDRTRITLSISEGIRRDMERFKKIERKIEFDGLAHSIDDIIDEFKNYRRQYSLSNQMEALIANLRKNGKIRTSETYQATLNSFRQFLASRVDTAESRNDIMLDCLTSEIMESYESWHRKKGNSSNTISFYTRILRAVYNRTMEDEITGGRNPFRHVYTGVDKTAKRALPLQHIRSLKQLDLSLDPSLDYARDMFLMSFYLRGMSFIDMAYLKKTDLRNGSVVYRRRKTGQQLTIGWTEEMQMLVDKYPDNPTQYLLPIIKRVGCNERWAYRNALYRVNCNIKKIGKMIGASDFAEWSSYRARHSWASVAKSTGIPLSVISEGMGHGSESTTRIYLASLDESVVDEANSIIISLL